MFRRLFKEHGARNTVTLFHIPSAPASCRILTQLKVAHAEGEEKPSPTLEASSSSIPQLERFPKAPQAPFELDIVNVPPTSDQLKTILGYIGLQQAGKLVQGAGSFEEAASLMKHDPAAFKGPLVVDWNSGKAVLGDDETEIQVLLKSIPRQ